MLEPKTFYRKMDALLNTITDEPSGTMFMPSILKALEQTFGSDLHFHNGRIYQELDGTFYLKDQANPDVTHPETLSPELPALQEVTQHGSYIYDRAKLAEEVTPNPLEQYTSPVAFLVSKGLLYRWLFVYDLTEGWVREEIELCINAVRAALNLRLFSDTVRSDLEQAAEIQHSLLPARAPQLPGYQIAGRTRSNEAVGGDLYDFITFGEGNLGVAIGDASGHGLPAALLVRDVVTGLRMGMEERLKMVHTLRKLNKVIHRSALSTRFISLFYGELEQNGNFFYVNAGHPDALIMNGDEVEILEPTGTVLGPLPELPLSRAFARIEPGGMIVLYTDGLVERWNKSNELFETERLVALLLKHQQDAPRQLVDRVFKHIDAYGEGLPWNDDATMVIIKRDDAEA